MGKLRPIMVKGHTRPLTMVKYNREGDLLFSTGKDHTPSVWYSDNGERIGTYDGHNGTVWCLDINCALLLPPAPPQPRVTMPAAPHAPTPAPLASLRGPPAHQPSCALRVAVDSTKLLTGSADNYCKLWEVRTGECLHTWKHTAPVRSVGFAIGDKQFLTVLDNIMGNTPTIFVWDLELDNLANHPDCPKLTIVGHTNKVNRALWGHTNERIYSGSDDTTIRMWDAKTGEMMHMIEGEHGKRVSDMQWNTEGTLLVTSSQDQWVRIFDKNLNLLKKYDTERPLNSACLSPLPNCPYLIAGGGQDAMAVTTTAAGQGHFESVFFDHVFDDELGSVGGHFGPINTLAFSPLGRSFASGGEDGYIRIHHFPEDYYDAFEKKKDEAFGRTGGR